MLRIDEGPVTEALDAAAPAPAAAIQREFDDPFLEFSRLMREATNIEQALMLQYLFAAFSLKPRYASVAGSGFQTTADNLFGVAIQEMKHFNKVNRILVELGVGANVQREDFPFTTGIYPFPLSLEPLSLESVAKYVAAEAPAEALDPTRPENAADLPFIRAIERELGLVHVVHLGSLYGTAIDVLGELIAAGAAFPDLARWKTVLEGIREQGITDHYKFFRSVFEGSHPGLGGAQVWANPGSDDYPSLPFEHDPSAFVGHERQIADPAARKIAWLSNLHYWLVLGLLDLSYAIGETFPDINGRIADGVFLGCARDHMKLAILPLGAALAGLGVGIPFDPLAFNVGLGVSEPTRRTTLRALVRETVVWEAKIEALPDDYSSGLCVRTLRALGG
jgi:hypothetical protein